MKMINNRHKWIIKVAILALFCIQTTDSQAWDIMSKWNLKHHILYDSLVKTCYSIVNAPRSFYEAYVFKKNAKDAANTANNIFAQKKDTAAYKIDCDKVQTLKKQSREKLVQGLGYAAKGCLNLLPFYIMQKAKFTALERAALTATAANIITNLVKSKGRLGITIANTTENLVKNNFFAWCCFGPIVRVFLTVWNELDELDTDEVDTDIDAAATNNVPNKIEKQ